MKEIKPIIIERNHHPMSLGDDEIRMLNNLEEIKGETFRMLSIASGIQKKLNDLSEILK